MTVRGKKPNVEAATAASPRSPRKHSGKEQQQEFTKLMEQMVKSMERVFVKGYNLRLSQSYKK